MIGAAIKRWRWALAIVALVLAALAYALWPEAKPVDLGTVSKGPMSVGITDDGVTREEDLYVVSAPVTGFASRITLEAGDKVEKGALISRISGRPSAPLDRRTQEQYRGMLATFRTNEASSAATLEQAQRDLVRAEALSKNGYVSRAALDSARTKVATDRAALQQARATIALISSLLADPGAAATGSPVPVRAPVNGTVLFVPGKSERIVAEGAPLITIGDPAKIEVVVDLLSREAVRVKPGDRVEITQWGGPKPLIGTVERIEPYGRLKVSALGIEEQRVDVIIGFDPATAGEASRLGHGYQVDATIILWSKPDALRVPIGALFRGSNGNWQVFVDENGRARERSVEVGHINADYGEVRTGLRAGETVVLNPGGALNDGDRIKLR